MRRISLRRRGSVVGLTLSAALSLAATSEARDLNASVEAGKGRSHVTRVEIRERVSPAFGGRSFGDVGPYEVLRGRAFGLADPLSPRNAGVVDLDKAPRNAEGLVEYDFDVAVLKPVDPSKANGTLVFEVTNRGRPLLQTSLLKGDGKLNEASGASSASILEQGYTLVWTGWQADLLAPAPGDLTASFPVATDSGRPITALVRDEIALDGSAGAQIPAIPAAATAFDATLYYPLAHPDGPAPRVRVRQRADEEPKALAPDRYQVTGTNRLHVQMEPGYDRGALYEVEYFAKDPKVLGLSFVSIRDLISEMRNRDRSGALEALGLPRIQRTIATGLSQSARYIRDFVYQDFNRDEAGRLVFDGMMPQGSGGKRGFFNQRFAQPGRAPDLQHEMRGYPGANFPFAYGDQVDPVSGRADGILARCTASASCPKIIHLDSDWEQWQQAGSLLVSDFLGRPVALPENVRAYMVTSTPHASLPPRADVQQPRESPPRAICEHILNPLTWAPVLRASLRNLEAWIKDGTPPPASRYPAGTAEGRVSIDALRNMHPSIPGYPFSPLYGKLQLVDFSKNPPELISDFAPYAVRFMRVNRDGNGIDGLVLPEVAVPIATYSGRNTRAAGFAQGELCHTLGAYIPFPRTQAEREATGDPRLSIAERYRDNDDYRAKLTEVARQLVADRLLLEEDAEIYRTYSLPN